MHCLSRSLSIFVLAALLVVSLAGCQLSLSKQELSNQSLKVAVFDGGSIMKSYQAEQGSEIHEQISNLILNTSKGWGVNFVSYAPGVMIYGDGFNINFVGDQAVYNGATGQMTRKIKPHDYLFMISN